MAYRYLHNFKSRIKNPKGRVCLCGNPAIQWKLHGWVCERCSKIEANMNKWEIEREFLNKQEAENFKLSQNA